MCTKVINAAILRTDGSISMQDIELAPRESVGRQIAKYGTAARQLDPTIAAIRFGFIRPCESWIGYANDEHMEAIAKAEREGRW